MRVRYKKNGYVGSVSAAAGAILVKRGDAVVVDEREERRTSPRQPDTSAKAQVHSMSDKDLEALAEKLGVKFKGVPRAELEEAILAAHEKRPQAQGQGEGRRGAFNLGGK